MIAGSEGSGSEPAIIILVLTYGIRLRNRRKSRTKTASLSDLFKSLKAPRQEVISLPGEAAALVHRRVFYDLLYDKTGGEFPGTVGIVECDGGHQILPVIVHTGGAAAV